MKRFMTIAGLMCVLCTSTLAGEIPSGGIAPPPATGTTEATPTTDPGEIPTVGEAESLSSDALSALLSVFSFCVR
jgi:hypothetical protein